MQLSAIAQRVAGCLIEKAMTTPDGYPLSANALRTACNQKTARDPVMSMDGEDLQTALGELREHGLVLTKYQHGSRVPKFAHLLDEKLDFKAHHLAVVGVLLLRGPQTAGEINGRTNRWHTFAGVAEVEETLQGLTDHKFHGAMVERLPRAPGQKEERWRHLLGPVAVASAVVMATAQGALQEELDALRDEVAALHEQNAQLQAELDQARRELDELTAPGM